MNPNTIIHLDLPTSTLLPAQFQIQGWIASMSEIKEIYLTDIPKVILNRVKRPDVEAAYPQFSHIEGFTGTAQRLTVGQNRLNIGYESSSGKFTQTFCLSGQAEPISEVFIYLDYPKSIPAESTFQVQGWVISQLPISRISMAETNAAPFEFVKRPDVENTYPNFPYVTGFVGTVTRDLVEVKEVNVINLSYKTPEGEYTYPVFFKEEYPLTPEQKHKKLKLISSKLICPNCKHPFTEEQVFNPDFSCSKCGEQYQYDGTSFNFLSSKLKNDFKIIDTTNVSANNYDGDPLASSLILQHQNGVILDCGAGKRRSDYCNVINFEIVPYNSTDVLGVGEKLPFGDETFDAIFSFAVLEHVCDPFACAKELVRVLKKGGTLYCVVPFLQPVHGYPNHYYNMTAQGLHNLFDNDLSIIQAEVPTSGSPIYTLTWFLRSWAAGLDDASKTQFLNMRVKDLLGNPTDYLKNSYVKNLTQEKNFELASTTMILAKKPESD